MAKEKQKKKPNPLKQRYKIVLMNENTFEEEWSFRLSLGNLIYGFGIISILLIVIGVLLVIYTPLKQWIPEYPTAEMRQALIDNSLKTDSLALAIQRQELYINNVKKILTGNPMAEGKMVSSTLRTMITDTTISRQYDSIIRAQVEYARVTNISPIRKTKEEVSLGQIQFFPPVLGVVSNAFNLTEQHYGIDIVTKPESFICATLSGTIIYAGWTLEGGNTIQIQHDNEIISVYKHNSKILKKQGDLVYAGEPIAVVGNTGEYSTGPHLHFEIWYKGSPLNPALYVSFN